MEHVPLRQYKNHHKDKTLMGEEIIVSVSPLETRVAVVEQGLLQEIFIERVHARVTVGNIYRGEGYADFARYSERFCRHRAGEGRFYAYNGSY